MILIRSDDLKLANLRVNKPIFVCGFLVYDVCEIAENYTNRIFRLTSNYQIEIQTDGKLWGCTYPQLEAEFFRPMEEHICGQAADKDIHRAATLHYADVMRDAATFLSSAPGKAPLIGYKWDLTISLQRTDAATVDAGLGWPEPSAINLMAEVIAVEPSTLVTVDDAFRMMRDVVENRQNAKRLAADEAEDEAPSVARPRRRLYGFG